MYQIVNSLSRWANTQHRLHTVHQEYHKDPSSDRCFLLAAYVLPIADVISSHGMLFHQYADDTQLYIAAKVKVDTATR